MQENDIQKIDLPRKPNYTKFSTGDNFFDLFRKIEKHHQNCFILESLGEQSYDARYCVIGFSPEKIVKGRKNQLIIDDEVYEVKNPYYAMRRMIPDDIISRNYAGGLVGYIGYDAMNFFEPALTLKEHDDFEPFVFGLYTDGLIYDTMTGETFYFYYHQDRSDQIREIAKEPTPEGSLEATFQGYSKTEEEHRGMVEQAIEEIKAGNTFQCQVGFQANYELRGDHLLVYQKLREVNPSPHMFYLKFDDTKLVGASPELLFRIRQGEVETFPLAGTTKRGENAQEDMELARVLLNDPKEIAEHNMLVDLHRNDLGRISKFGSVKVRRLMDVKKFSHVQHISSEVVGLISRSEDMFSGLAKNFPAGTLSGAPKIESMKIIQRIEGDSRGPYGGSVGHFGFNADSTHVIPIRTLFIKDDKAFSRASGGVVYDSTPQGEYQEIMRKSAAMKKTLESFMTEVDA